MKVKITYKATTTEEIEVPDDLNISVMEWLEFERQMPLEVMAEAEWVVDEVMEVGGNQKLIYG